MKKVLLNILILCMAICSALCVFTACSESPISFKLNFVVESEIVKTIDTTGNEKISLPENPKKDGYDFDGWFWDKGVWEKPFTANSLLDAPLSSDMSVYAKFTLKPSQEYDHNTFYTIEYYLENLNNDSFTLKEKDVFNGVVGTHIDAEIKEFQHFTFNNDTSLSSGDVLPNGNLTLKIFYNRNLYSIIQYGTGGNINNRNAYKYGNESVNVKAIEYLGWDFVGWFNEDELLTMDKDYVFTCEFDITAKFEEKDEMQNFIFTSNQTDCKIVSIIDKNVTKIIIPSYVTEIQANALCGCSVLKELVLPFVGAKKDASIYEINYPLGYIFGKFSETNGDKIEQRFYGVTNSGGYRPVYTGYYIIPNSLEKVTVVDEKIHYGAFSNCHFIKEIVLPTIISGPLSEIEGYTFFGCSSLLSVNLYSGRLGDFALRGCSSLTTINYNGTKSQWQTMLKGEYWNEGVPTNCIVYCIDEPINIYS